MKREELLAKGVTEEAAEWIMSEYGKAIQNANAKTEQEKAKADQFKADLDKAMKSGEKLSDLQGKLDALKAELDSALTEKETANQQAQKAATDNDTLTARVKELEMANAREKSLKTVVGYGVAEADAEALVKADGTFDIATLGKIISDTRAAGKNEQMQEILNQTTNPNGGSNDQAATTPTEPDDVSNAKAITFGGVSNEQIEARNYYK